MQSSSYNLDSILYYFNGNEPLTIRHACEGVQIEGIGSGKTSGSGAALAKAYLKAGFGGLVLCAKKDELDTWKCYAKETGREQSLLVFNASCEWRFPFLQYEINRKDEGAGYTENLVRLFSTVSEAIERGVGGGGKNALPELTRKCVVIVMNIPVKEYGVAGRAAQFVYKYMWQQAAERRDTSENPRSVFLWVDEAQNFATENDMQFQATARSSRACTVYLTQYLVNYYAKMGGVHSKYRVDSLVGNLQTIIWHANSDSETNNHAAETIGKSWQTRKTEVRSFGVDNSGMSESVQESNDFDVIPQAFTRLRKGGPPNDFTVDAMIFQKGRIWLNDKTYLPVSFNQKIL